MPKKAVALSFVVAVSLAGCRGGSARDERREPGSPPLQLAGGTFVCAQEYAAYEDRFYPPNHPAIPPKNIRPTGCFSSVDEARRSGYTLAPTPPGDRLVSGIYLVRSSARLLRRCRRAAGRLDIPVPCPGFVPTRQTDASLCGPCGGQRKFVLNVDFIGPSTYVGTGPYGGEGHLVFAGARSLLDIDCFGSRARPSVLKIKRRPTEWLRCANGSETHSGHVILRWRDRQAAYAVSIHNDTRANRLLAATLARAVRVVR